MPQQPNNTPYSSAAGAYGNNVLRNTPDQRELESHILLKSARFLEDLQKNWESVNGEVLEETLKYNRQIWMLFYDNAIEDLDETRTNDLRSNIVNLANFVFKRSIDILAKPEKQKLDVLININREIAAGLSARQKAENAAQPANVTDIKNPPSGGTSTTA